MNMTSSTPSERTQRGLLNLQGHQACSMMESLLFLHPSGAPDGSVRGPINWLVTPPGSTSSTARWRSFRETCARISANNPDNPKAQAMVTAVDQVLTWRAELPEHLHFWDEDA
jgi:hypothetical protein